MKFTPLTLNSLSPRLGVISDIDRLPDLILRTPMPMLYTRGGCVPHLTEETLKYVIKESHCLQVPLPTSQGFYDSIGDSSLTLPKFIGQENHLIYMTVIDPAEELQDSHHVKDQLPIWTKSGKSYVTPDSYMDMVESFQPDVYCLLSDAYTHSGSSNKRISKSVEQTVNFFRKCMARHKKSPILKKAGIVAAIEGGLNFAYREKCINAILREQDLIEGFLFNGLHYHGYKNLIVNFEHTKPVLQHMLEKLPPAQFRVVEGCYHPYNIVKFVGMGVDVFDTSYCNAATERNCALVYDFNEGPPKDMPEIYLSDEIYVEDTEPILKECTCYTCQKYTRAYIHHLLNTREMLAPILITIHNMHHFMEFFKRIRQCIEEGTLGDLEILLKKQFEPDERPGLKPEDFSPNQLGIEIPV